MLFDTRKDAAEELERSLAHLKDDPGVIVAGIPEGGAVVGAQVALRLGVRFMCLGVYKVPAPTLPDLTIGVLDADGEVTVDPRTEMTRHEVRKAGESTFSRLRSDMLKCHGDLGEPDVTGAHVVVVDDAVFSPLGVQAAASYLRRHGAKTVDLAVPVMSEQVSDAAKASFDSAVVLHVGGTAGDLGHYYKEHGIPSSDELLRTVRAAYETHARPAVPPG